jgi:hypothetical protein
MKTAKYLTLATLAVLLLSACASVAEPTATQGPTSIRPTATEGSAAKGSDPTDTPTEPASTATEPSQTATAEETSQPATDTPEPDDVFAFLEVGPDEWVRGPDDAQVTVVEYADFQ